MENKRVQVDYNEELDKYIVSKEIILRFFVGFKA